MTKLKNILFVLMLVFGVFSISVLAEDGENNITDNGSSIDDLASDDSSSFSSEDLETTDDLEEDSSETDEDDSDNLDDSSSNSMVVPRTIAQNIREKVQERVQDRKELEIDNRMNRTLLNEKMDENARVRIMENMMKQYQNLNDDQKNKIGKLYDDFKENEKYKLQKLNELDSDKIKKITNMNSENMQEFLNLSRGRIQEYLKQYSEDELTNPIVLNKINKEINDRINLAKNDYKIREIQKEILERAKERYQEVKEKYDEIKNRYFNTKQNLEQKREQVRNCFKENSDNNQCSEEINVSKEYLIKTTDSLILALEKVKSKVEGSEDISDENSVDIISKIDEIITKLNDAKSSLESAQTIEEIKTVASEIKSVWPQANRFMKYGAGVLLNNKVGSIIANMESLETRLELALQKLSDANETTTEIDSKISEFSSKVASAKDSYELAQEKWVEIKTANNVDELAKEANQYMQNSRNFLKEANEILREILREINSKNNGSTALAESNVDVAEASA